MNVGWEKECYLEFCKITYEKIETALDRSLTLCQFDCRCNFRSHNGGYTWNDTKFKMCVTQTAQLLHNRPSVSQSLQPTLSGRAVTLQSASNKPTLPAVHLMLRAVESYSCGNKFTAKRKPNLLASAVSSVSPLCRWQQERKAKLSQVQEEKSLKGRSGLSALRLQLQSLIYDGDFKPSKIKTIKWITYVI